MKCSVYNCCNIVLLLCLFLLPNTNGKLIDVIDYTERALDQLFEEEETTRTADDKFKARGFGNPTLNLDKPIPVTDGFMLCFNTYLIDSMGLSLRLNSQLDFLHLDHLNSELYLASSEWQSKALADIRMANKPFGWIHTCMDFSPELGEVVVTVENKQVFTMDAHLNSSLQTIGFSWEMDGAVFPLMVTQINLFSRRKRVSSCGETGDLYVWNVDDWKEEDGAPITSISKKILSNVCNNNEDIFLPFLTVRESTTYCTAIARGTLMNPAIDKNLSEYMDLHHVEYVWLPFSGNHNDEFVDIYTNKSLNAQWLPPKQDITGNHLDVSLVLAYGPGKGVRRWRSDNWSKTICRPAVPMPHLEIRGLAANSDINTMFYPSVGVNGTLYWTGFSKLSNMQSTGFLRFSKASKQLKYLTVHSKTTAEINLSEPAGLFGIYEMDITGAGSCNNRVKCFKNISASVCNANEFNCNDGSCIGIGARCDGWLQCKDGSDETFCSHNLLIDPAYDKTVITKVDRTKTVCQLTLEILDVIAIDDRNSFINPTFSLSLEWRDERVKTQDLSRGEVRQLHQDIIDSIWQPILNILDIKQFQRDTLSPVEIYARVDESAARLPMDSSLIHNKEMYPGNSSTLNLRTTKSAFFSCSFSMLWNPFDVQMCSIKLKLSSWQSHNYAEVIAKEIVFTGQHSIQQFTLHSVRFNVDNDDGLILGEMVFVRSLNSFIFTIGLPSVIAIIVSHASNYFEKEHFEAAIGVNLTILLVLTTMLVNIASTFEQADGFTMIAIWMGVSMFIPFVVVLMTTWVHNVKDDNSSKEKCESIQMGQMFFKDFGSERSIAEPADEVDSNNVKIYMLRKNKLKRVQVFDGKVETRLDDEATTGFRSPNYIKKIFRKVMPLIYLSFISLFFLVGQVRKHFLLQEYKEHTV